MLSKARDIRRHMVCLLYTSHDALAPTGVRQIYGDSLEESVVRASEVAKQNDMVLLSPACASMDMFRNYAHRSEVFVTQVRRLGGASGGEATS